MTLTAATSSNVSIVPDGVSLCFQPGDRPNVETLARIVQQAEAAGLGACISFCPVDAEDGWLEILANGLTFDLVGLSPAGPVSAAKPCQTLGFEGGDHSFQVHELEAIRLVPSGHITAGAGLQPIVRSMMSVAANLASQLPVRAVGWTPAATLMEPRYFRRAVFNWLGGGPFPALGLTAIQVSSAGATTIGLNHFIGQELQLAALAQEPPASLAKFAMRVIDRLVEMGRVSEPVSLQVGREHLHLEPSRFGKLLLGWRDEAD